MRKFYFPFYDCCFRLTIDIVNRLGCFIIVALNPEPVLFNKITCIV